VLGVTSEGKGPTEKWIKEKSVKYAYAYDPGGKLSRSCGVTGIPHAVLIDATGKVVYEGGPEGVNTEAIEKATVGALKKPLWELPKPFAKLRAALGKGDWTAALKEAETLKSAQGAPEEAPSVYDSVKALIAGALAGAEAMETAGDFLGATREYERIAKSAKGLPEDAKAREKLAALAKNPDAKKGVKAQKDFEKVLAEPIRSEKDQRELKAALEAIVKKNESAFVVKRAEEALAKMEKH
jgi:hypothetical protein